jgi:hypothetical protein
MSWFFLQTSAWSRICNGLLVFVLFSVALFTKAPLESKLLQDHPHLDERMRTLMAPYLLPLNHPIKETLDSIFLQSRAIEDENALIKAGFVVIAAMQRSFIIVARHPAVPGYVFKLYLDSETRSKEAIPHWEWLTRRCIGAEKVRKIIHKNKLLYFTVPDKWLYILPVYPFSRFIHPQPAILVETDMQIENEQKTRMAWKTIKRKHLDELYTILKSGNGTTALMNIPYTKQGTFAFIDTEYFKRRLQLQKVKHFLSKEMCLYWDQLNK